MIEFLNILFITVTGVVSIICLGRAISKWYSGLYYGLLSIIPLALTIWQPFAYGWVG